MQRQSQGVRAPECFCIVILHSPSLPSKLFLSSFCPKSTRVLIHRLAKLERKRKRLTHGLTFERNLLGNVMPSLGPFPHTHCRGTIVLWSLTTFTTFVVLSCAYKCLQTQLFRADDPE